MQHPEIPEIDFISYVMVIGDDDPANGSLTRGDGAQRPRRPLAVRHGELGPAGLPGGSRSGDTGSRFIARSLIDSEFTVEIIGETTVGGRPAVLPRISGRGWVFGTRTSSVDPTDPYPLGYVLSDVWGDEVGTLSNRVSAAVRATRTRGPGRSR